MRQSNAKVSASTTDHNICKGTLHFAIYSHGTKGRRKKKKKKSANKTEQAKGGIKKRGKKKKSLSSVVLFHSLFAIALLFPHFGRLIPKKKKSVFPFFFSLN